MIRVLAILSLCFLGAACSPQYSGKQPPKVINGEIDLTGWDFEKDGPVNLDGDWLFAWEKFVEPAPWEELKEQMVHTLSVPGAWAESAIQPKTNGLLPGTGYASYAVLIKGIKRKGTFGIRTSQVSSAAEILITDTSGSPIYTENIGKLGFNRETELPALLNYSLLDLEKLSVANNGSIIVIFKISNYHHSRGGLWFSSIADIHGQLVRRDIQESQFQDLMTGMLLIIGLYHIILFTQRHTHKPELFFGLFCLAVALRSFSVGTARSGSFSDQVILWNLITSLEYLSITLVPISAIYFIKSLFINQISSLLAKGVFFSALPLLLLVIFSTPLHFSNYLPIIQLHLLLSMLCCLAILFYFSMKDNKVAQILLLSGFIAALGAVNDILHTNGTIQTIYLSPYTMVSLVLIQAGLISYGNAQAHKKAEAFAAELIIEMKENKGLQQSNRDLEEKQKKYGKLIEELSEIYAQTGEQLDAAKAEQSQIAKELHEASTQLIQAEKLSGLGAMVSGIAHDINNPLNFIETARFQEQEKLDQLKEHLLGLVPQGKEGEEFKADLLVRFEKLGKLNDQIKTGVTRVTEISKSMRNASRADIEKTNDVNLVEVIQESLIITGNRVKQFQLVNNIPDGIALATCNRSQIGQVVMNFLSNAADALVEYKKQYKDHKGIIQVDLAISNQNKDQKQPKSVQLAVSDNGAGVHQEDRDKVLKAFFTTKTAGAGTGLGLAICDKIAQAHDGTIHIEDGLPNGQGGHGARFILEFVDFNTLQ